MTRSAFLLSALALLGGCATVGPDFTRPATAPEARYASPRPAAATLGDGPALRWWEAFHAPQLDALVDRAIAQNRSLAAANATLERAQERVNAIAGRRLPQADANSRHAREQVNLSAYGLDATRAGGADISNPQFTLYSVGSGVSYDLDLFGGVRRAVEQAGAESDAQRFQAQAAHLTIAGRVVGQVLAIAALNDRIATERALLGEDARNISLTQARQRAGVGTMVEVLSAQGQLAADQGGLPQLEQRRSEARSMLAVLQGLSPGELGATDFSLAQFTLPADVPVALPSALVQKRPDILLAEARLHAATAAIGVATARLYPDVTLGASFTQSTTQAANLLSAGSRGFDIFAGFTAPLFRGGTLKAEQRGAQAGAKAAAASYEQTVLEAFGQVSDLLDALGNDARDAANQREAASLAARSLHLSRRSFEVGNSGILQVLDASRANQRAQIGLLDARARQFMDVTRLYVATAGGWTGPATPAAQQVEAP